MKKQLGFSYAGMPGPTIKPIAVRPKVKAPEVMAHIEAAEARFDVESFVANFEVLAESEESVKKLRELILELAIRGKLTSTQSDDDSVETLLGRIRQEVTEAGGSGKGSAALAQEVIPFEIPPTWRWARWGNLTLDTSSGWSPQCESRARADGEWGVLKVSAVSWFAFKPEQNKALPRGVPPRPAFEVRPGDFLMSRANTSELVGRSVIVEGPAERLLLSDKLVRCHLSRWIEKRFLNLYNRTASARAHYLTHASGTSDSMKNISREVILSMPVPLPPLAEQKRIVAKVDELMRMLDDLEAKQAKKREVQGRLRTAVLEALTSAEGPDELEATWKRVSENFEVLFERAEGVGDLRRTLVSLAMQGRLVSQDPRAVPITVVLDEVARNREWRIPERESKVKLDPNIESLAGKAQVPRGWAEPRLNDFAQLINGRAYAQSELLALGTPVIRIQNLNGGSDWYYSDLVLPDRQYCDNGDLLFAWSASFGPYIWGGERAIYHYHIWKLNLSEAVDKMFMFYVFRHLTDVVKERSHGLAMLHMTKAQMERWPILLPPLSEQRRIVAKLEQLMKLCDDFEAKLKSKEAIASRLVEAVVRDLVA